MLTQPDEDDEIMAELRRNREAILARFGYDMNLVMEDRRRIAKEFKGKASVAQEGGTRTIREAET
jgi:hypothetical protein